jgi:TetR/AcrR family transcriptional regulator, mexJK operon transcriptional repressor
VLERLMARWLSGADELTRADDLEHALNEAAARILDIALTPEAIALHRLLIAESLRFPELPRMLDQAGASQGTTRIAALLERAVVRGVLPPQDTVFAAEQFIHLVLAGPQRRALGLGPKLDEQQMLVWRTATIALFLRGVRS